MHDLKVGKATFYPGFTSSRLTNLNQMIQRLLPLAALLFLFACNTTKPAVMDGGTIGEVRDLDTMTVTPEQNGVIYDVPADEPVVEIPNDRPVYRAAYERTHDLLHTKLRVSFDWEKEMVMGEATLRLEPIFNPSRELVLDAKQFTFNSIRMNGNDLPYVYEGDKQTVTIDLGREYKRGEEYELTIDYTAIPAQSGGSAAITSDKGLFFINPRGEESDKPRQIWTQGETENNSRWFPTIDKPNERCTQEIYITVADKYKTLSNGVLVSSTPAANGKRTDYWRMDLPHAPYLFMLTVGEFDIVEDEQWDGIPVNYYLEPKWSPYAKSIFPYTREMLSFFSDVTGTHYPWPKYSQVAVRDYVSGAMENTTAVIFGEFMHGTDRDLIDEDTNEKIVAHEMFHHWFGDLVTCESWSNLTLNEGFANYSEYLWMERKHGKDAADYHLLQEWQGYLGSLQRGEPHELIWYDYDDKEQMFDAHSYNKGGSVLHMLRNYLGDEAFFTSLKNYLSSNEFTAVEVDELRLAFEETTGQDLNWFFNQWFHQAGHPKLSIETGYADGQVSLTVAQTQDTDNNVPAIFRIPVDVDVYTAAGPTRHRIWIDQREQNFSFPSATQPEVVIFDPQHQLLAEYDYEKSESELIAQFNRGGSFLDRYSALARLQNSEGAPAGAIITKALGDDFYVIRGAALQSIETPTPEQLPLIRTIAREDSRAAVRALAIETLSAAEDEGLKAIAESALTARSYDVVAAGFTALMSVDPEAAKVRAAELETVDNDAIAATLAELYGESGDLTKLPYIDGRLDVTDGMDAISLYGSYGTLLSGGSTEQVREGISRLSGIATNMGQSPWRRLAATRSLSELGKTLKAEMDAAPMKAEGITVLLTEITSSIATIKAAETNADLKGIYEQFYGRVIVDFSLRSDLSDGVTFRPKSSAAKAYDPQYPERDPRSKHQSQPQARRKVPARFFIAVSCSPPVSRCSSEYFAPAPSPRLAPRTK